MIGNRGHNQPVKDMLTDKVYITPQNHGYAVDHSDLPPGMCLLHCGCLCMQSSLHAAYTGWH